MMARLLSAPYSPLYVGVRRASRAPFLTRAVMRNSLAWPSGTA